MHKSGKTIAVLRHFATRIRLARQEYQAFVAEGVKNGSRPDLQGGVLIRSDGRRAVVSRARAGVAYLWLE